MKKLILLALLVNCSLFARQTAYEKKEYQYDWDYQDNWRHDRHAYLSGGIQPEINPTSPPYGQEDKDCCLECEETPH